MTAKVLHIIGSFDQGGSERQALQLVSLLHERSAYKVHLATLKKEGVLLGNIERLGLPEVPEFRLKSFFDLNFARKTGACVSYIRRNKIDIVQTHDFYTNVFGILAARIAKVPVRIAAKRETGRMRTSMQTWVERHTFSGSHFIVANSIAVKEYLTRNGVLDNKINVIYNGLDTSRFHNVEVDRKSICNKFGLPAEPDNQFVILLANLHHSVKNHQMLLAAAENVLKSVPSAHFILAGEGELVDQLAEQCANAGISKNVHFPGRCMDVPALLAITNVGVLTSKAEGFSNAILEYMAAGLPVVATNVGGAAEAIEDTKSGFLIESGDHESLSARLIILLNDHYLARRLGEHGKELVAKRFSIESQLASTIDLYERGLAGE